MNSPHLPVVYRRALEALRNGVPNRDAVQTLGCNQDEAERHFLEQLDTVGDPSQKDVSVPGLLVQGGFGTGKSHLLEYFEHRALSENFVCSRIVISKETPLYNPEKVFLAALENGIAPDVSGKMIDEIAVKLNPNSPSYAELSLWANQEASGVSQLFPATLILHERLHNNPELVQDIVNFWAGDRMLISKIRQGLKSIGQAHAYTIRAVRARELAMQRFNFALHLIRGAGYKGWVILIDEIELISRYSILQRGRAYAELARWMGKVTNEGYPGLVVVGAITDDFAANRLEGVRGDLDYVAPKLQARGTDEFTILATRAETGMQIIKRKFIKLADQNNETLESTYSKLKEIHSIAYNWMAPDVPHGSQRTSRRMRSHVRRWINEWDLKRLYPDADVQIEEQPLQVTYSEDTALEKEMGEDSGTESIQIQPGQ